MKQPLRLLDLFSGIGGFSVGLEKSGACRTVAFVERDKFCQSILRKHWPDVPIYEDVCEVTAERLGADGIEVDVICGGFPCQDLSRANGVWSDRPGLAGERSGLWSEYARIICEVDPELVIVENVTDLLDQLRTVLATLSACGRNAEWDCLPATVVGGRIPRDRIWLLSDTNSERPEREHRRRQPRRDFSGIFDALARRSSHGITHADWLSEPSIPRVVDGVSGGLDRAARTNALGNVVVPQMAELLGSEIVRRL